MTKKDAYMDAFERYAQRMNAKSMKWLFPGNTKYVDKKIKRFIKYFYIPVEWDTVMAFLDTTILHNSKEGILVTTEGISVKEPLEKMYFLDFAGIKEVGYHVEEEESYKETKTIEVIYEDGRVRRVLDYYFDQYLFVEFLKTAVELAKQDFDS